MSVIDIAHSAVSRASPVASTAIHRTYCLGSIRSSSKIELDLSLPLPAYPPRSPMDVKGSHAMQLREPMLGSKQQMPQLEHMTSVLVDDGASGG